MKTIKQIIALTLSIAPMLCQAQTMEDGLVMTGTFSGWRGYTGNNSGGTLNLSSFVEGFVANRHTIVTPGTDPIVDNVINRTFPGQTTPDTFSIRLGNSIGGAQAEVLSFKLPDYQEYSPYWGFSFAFVGQDLHEGVENPFISIWVSTSDDLATSMDAGFLLGDVTLYLDSDSFFQSLDSANILYREWTRFELLDLFPALNSYSGSDLTVYFATADCPASAHWGYAYIDNVNVRSRTNASFKTLPIFSLASASPITINGSASIGESNYLFRIVKCNSAGVPLSGAPTYTTIPFTGFVPSSLNIRPYLNSAVPLGYFTVGTYYRLTLETWNSGNVSTSQASQVIRCVL